MMEIIVNFMDFIYCFLIAMLAITFATLVTIMTDYETIDEICDLWKKWMGK